MKLTFFGASVTAQKEGYWFFLSKFLKSEPNVKAYGGQHLCDAGICRLNEVVQTKPELCIVDWLSTGFDEISDRTKIYLDTIIHAFSSINCRLIFIILPKEEHNSRKEFYSFVKQHLDSKGVSYIDINDFVLFSDKICRDSVHTTPYGSRLYAKIIFREYNKIRQKLAPIQDTLKTEYSDVKSIRFGKKVENFILLEGKGKIVTFALTMGKGNGYVQVRDKKILTWDRWCHYERLNCKINDNDIDGELKITILEDDFDYSSCKESTINFNKIKKFLKIEEIFYTGELKVINFS